MSEGVNHAIAKAVDFGAVTSASLMANMPFLEHALEIAKERPQLGLGAHISLNVGKPVSRDTEVISQLTGPDGFFHASPLLYLWKSFDRSFCRAVEIEMEAQLDRLSSFGLHLDHINSQSHLHMIPNFFPIFRRAALRRNIPHLRIVREKINFFSSLQPSGFRVLLMNFFGRMGLNEVSPIGESPDFIGFRYSCFLDLKKIKSAMGPPYPRKLELMVHPVVPDSSLNRIDYQDFVYDFLTSPDRVLEVQMLQSPEFLEFFESLDAELVTFGRLYERSSGH